mgnify:CR=1 FL=1
MKKKKGFRLKHLLIFLFIFWLSKSLISQKVVIKDAKKEIIENKEEIAKIQREIEELNKEIEEKDSLDFVEKVAREELKMVKPREIMYIDKNKDKRPFINPRK